MDSNEKIVKDAMEAEEKSRRALRHLLDQQRDKNGHLLALRLFMGKSPSYLVSATLNWVAENVKFAADIPLFQADEISDARADQDTKEIFIREDTIEDVQQRSPDWRRQLQMAVYLAARPNHKFPPILAVGYQGWVYQENSEKWGPDKRAMEDSVTATHLDNKGNYCDLDSKGTLYYALDGQHRLMAIKGLKELLETGQLAPLNKERKASKPVITRDEVIAMVSNTTGEDKRVVHERLQRVMMEERIGIEIIPAIVNGESYKDALLRLRMLFVNVNENAKKPTKGESILLDESNGFRIVARRVMVTHRLLKDKVDHRSSQLSENSGCYTALGTLAQIAQEYLGAKKEFAQWENKMFGEKQLGFIRPEESEMHEATNVLSEYFDAFASLTSHVRMLGGKNPATLRAYEEGDENKEDNILFRPIAQAAFAKAIATLEQENEKSLKSIIAQVAKQEKAGQLKLHNKKAPWFGVLCDPADGKMRRKKEHQDMCYRLLTYLLGGGESNDDVREALREEFANMRAVTEKQAYSLTGDLVEKEKVQLPELW